jgi:hypothetical protein
MFNLKKKSLYFLVIFLSFIFNTENVFANKMSMGLCIKVSNSMNQNTPQVVDKATILISTTCLPGPVFLYKYELSDLVTYLPDSFARNLRTKWCTTPTLINLLSRLKSVQHTYYSDKGSFIRTVTISEINC